MNMLESKENPKFLENKLYEERTKWHNSAIHENWPNLQLIQLKKRFKKIPIGKISFWRANVDGKNWGP